MPEDKPKQPLPSGSLGGWGPEDKPTVRLDLNDASTLENYVRQVAGDASNISAVSLADSERNFYVAIAIYSGAFATGLYLFGAEPAYSSAWWFGVVFAVAGGAGAVSVTPLFRNKLPSVRAAASTPKTLWAAAIVTWLFLAANVGFSFHDHFWPKAAPSQQGAIAPDVWPALSEAQETALASRVKFIPPEEIVVACETLKCRDLADGIADILQKTQGWHVSILHRGGLDITGVTGIQLNPSEPATEALRDAIEATTGLAVTLGPETRKDLGSDARTFLTVGTRPF